MSSVAAPAPAGGQTLTGTDGADRLRLKVPPTFAMKWLIPRLPKFAAAHPEIQLSVSSSISLVDFESEPIDAALRFGPGAWPGVVAEHLFDEWMTPLASPAVMSLLAPASPAAH